MIKKSWIIIFAIILFVIACKFTTIKNSPSANENKLTDKVFFPKDTLHVVTQYSATSFFIYRDEKMGYDYEMAVNLAKHFHLVLKVYPANTDEEMITMLRNKQVDLAIYNTIETKELKNEFNFICPQEDSYLVLVQMMGRDAISDPTELIGKEIWVKENSIQDFRLKSLNDEVGGGIIIKYAEDSVNTDNLMQDVADKKIKYTLSYRQKALLQKTFNPRLDCRIPIGFMQKNGWLIRKSETRLTDSIKSWYNLPATKRLADNLYGKYWEKNPYFAFKKIHIPKGAISPYDIFFKKHASEIGWDWRLLAAVAFAESGFDNSLVSWAGARGLMQLMPQTARDFGVDASNITDPEKSIEAGVEYIKSLNMIYRKIEDKDERIKFILASYNSGPAHILDAMALAEKYGKNPHIWFDNVEYYLAKKNDPQFYKDPVVKYGIFRAKETLRYVPNVLNTYEKFLERK